MQMSGKHTHENEDVDTVDDYWLIEAHLNHVDVARY